MGSTLALSCNIWSFVIELDYGYRYLLEVHSKLSSICFLSWLRYYSMLALHDRPVLAMVNISALELYQLLQYSYVCSSVMSVHLDGGGSAWDTRVSLTSIDMVSRLAKSCWMSTIPTVLWQNHLNYSGSSAQAITIKATPTQTHFKRNNSSSVG